MPAPPLIYDQGVTQKYILIQAGSDLLVRGNASCEYHADVFRYFQKDLKASYPGVELNILGGGRITVTDTPATVRVHGYSQAYGICDHSIAANAIQEVCGPSVTVSYDDEGY